jgi:hypothetical protein
MYDVAASLALLSWVVITFCEMVFMCEVTYFAFVFFIR